MQTLSCGKVLFVLQPKHPTSEIPFIPHPLYKPDPCPPPCHQAQNAPRILSLQSLRRQDIESQWDITSLVTSRLISPIPLPTVPNLPYLPQRLKNSLQATISARTTREDFLFRMLFTYIIYIFPNWPPSPTYQNL